MGYRFRAHPRVCGENLLDGDPPVTTSGSSPRVRGKHTAGAPLRPDPGLIPACAGKTGRPRTRPWRSGAHPRVCGENPAAATNAEVARGSSPRVRGKRRARGGVGALRGLIPARAGKTDIQGCRYGSAEAHPRACGENPLARSHARRSVGSSPRVRGKREHAHQGMLGARLIPARAGKTGRRSRRTGARTAHPRACGENREVHATGGAGGGSSPRVRGKRASWIAETTGSRLIPARAGKTHGVALEDSHPTAHPRACGENSMLGDLHLGTGGSSPRVRGKPPDSVPSSCAGRLIPARAGKTHWRATCPGARAAHPCACGENHVAVVTCADCGGSSLRVRGKHFLTWAFTAQAGQILETLEPSAFSGSYSFPGARANGGQRRAHRRGLCTGPALGRPLGAS